MICVYRARLMELLYHAVFESNMRTIVLASMRVIIVSMNTQEYKEKLESEKQLLERELGTVAVADEHAVGGFAPKEDDFTSEPASLDPVELGTEMESFTRNEAISSELEERYQAVVDALERIEEGSYGKCTVCEAPIEEARLDANPAAPTCTEHMEEE